MTTRNDRLSHTQLEAAIQAAFEDEAFWTELADNSLVRAGPFDGGCLICAKALILALDAGSLIRIISDVNGGQTEHYGVLHEDVVFDFSGAYESPEQWIQAFRDISNLKDRFLSVKAGYDPASSDIDDPTATKRVRQIILHHITQQQARPTASLST